jgi:hypothetical protein
MELRRSDRKILREPSRGRAKWCGLSLGYEELFERGRRHRQRERLTRRY